MRDAKRLAKFTAAREGDISEPDPSCQYEYGGGDAAGFTAFYRIAKGLRLGHSDECGGGAAMFAR